MIKGKGGRLACLYREALSEARELASKGDFFYVDSIFNELRYASRHMMDAYCPLENTARVSRSPEDELDRALQHTERALFDIPESKVIRANETLKILLSKNPDSHELIWNFRDDLVVGDNDDMPLSIKDMRRMLIEVSEFDKDDEDYKQLRQKYEQTVWICYYRYSTAPHFVRLRERVKRLKFIRVIVFLFINLLCCFLGVFLGSPDFIKNYFADGQGSDKSEGRSALIEGVECYMSSTGQGKQDGATITQNGEGKDELQIHS